MPGSLPAVRDRCRLSVLPAVYACQLYMLASCICLPAVHACQLSYLPAVSMCDAFTCKLYLPASYVNQLVACVSTSCACPAV